MSVIFALLALGGFLAAANLSLRLARARVDARRLSESRAMLEKRVRQLEADMAESSAAHARLLGSVTHELRTPLTAIIGYQELLDDGIYGNIEERCREPLRRIGSAAEHLLRLVDGILDLARLEVGQVVLRLAEVDIAAACRDAAAHANDALRNRDISLELELAKDLPRVNSDRERVIRTIELAMAAAIHTGHGGTLTLMAAPAGDGGVEIRVDGVRKATGTDPDMTAAERIARSAGFRLDVADRLARTLGAELDVLDSPDSASIRLRLPAAAPEAAPAERSAAGRADPTGTAQTAPHRAH